MAQILVLPRVIRALITDPIPPGESALHSRAPHSHSLLEGMWLQGWDSQDIFHTTFFLQILIDATLSPLVQVRSFHIFFAAAVPTAIRRFHSSSSFVIAFSARSVHG